jgi:hypothetical protein
MCQWRRPYHDARDFRALRFAERLGQQRNADDDLGAGADAGDASRGCRADDSIVSNIPRTAGRGEVPAACGPGSSR